MNLKNIGLAKLIDMGGTKKAVIAPIQEELDAINAEIMHRVKAGEASEGQIFRVAHILQTPDQVAWKKIAEYLKPSRQLIAANTKKGKREFVKYTARQTN